MLTGAGGAHLDALDLLDLIEPLGEMHAPVIVGPDGRDIDFVQTPKMARLVHLPAHIGGFLAIPENEGKGVEGEIGKQFVGIAGQDVGDILDAVHH